MRGFLTIGYCLRTVSINVFSEYCSLAYAGTSRSFFNIHSMELRLKATFVPPATFLHSPVLQV